MRAPPQTYQMGEPSFRSPTLETIARKVVTGGAATSVVAEFTSLAKDKLLVLTNVSGNLGPGATQACVSIKVDLFTAAGANFNVYREVFPETANLDETFNWQGECTVRGQGAPNVVVRATAVFDAGVASNQLSFSFMGYIIPRANVAEY